MVPSSKILERDVIEWVSEGSYIVFDGYWQSPAKTEQHAYFQLRNLSLSDSAWTYIAFPWATLIDGLERGLDIGDHLLECLGQLSWNACASSRVLTTCQHIKFAKYSDLFNQVGITDVFASHAPIGQLSIDGMRLHPFPLYPVQADSVRENPFSIEDFNARRFTYSFIGAHNPSHYLSDTRERIFSLPSADDVHLKLRDGWHFERHVYAEQMLGHEPVDRELESEEAKANEYVAVLEQTKFSLCPSGTGPNSIRLWESIEHGSIPVILADTLALPGAKELWAKACVFVPEADESLRELPAQLRRLAADSHLISEKLLALRELRGRYGRYNFVQSILETQKAIKAAERIAPETIEFCLVTSRLELSEVHEWKNFLYRAGQAVNRSVHIIEEKEELSTSLWFRGKDLRTEDVAITSSELVLSAQILRRYDYFYIIPQRAPARYNEHLLVELITTIEQNIDGQEVWRPKATLISSVYDGDAYIRNFLDNASEITSSEKVEHLLFRVPSNGKETAALVEYVTGHAAALLILCAQDPGLYSIWNLGTQLASSPYIGNANIDDKRAPNQVDELTKLLDQYPQAAVASAGLRVVDDPEATWESNESVDIWYTENKTLTLEGDALYAIRAGRVVPYNFPHCLPMWRSYLQSAIGGFDESSFGPSADWEYWLRAASYGAIFVTHPEALGLYYRAPESYWRRNPDAPNFDQIIASEHVSSIGVLRSKSISDPFPEIVGLFLAGESLDLFAMTGLLVRMLSKHDASLRTESKETLLINSILDVSFGVPRASVASISVKLKHSIRINQFVDNLFFFLNEVARKCRLGSLVSLRKVCLDSYRQTSDIRFLIVTAFISGRLGQDRSELRLLRFAQAVNIQSLLVYFQDVYQYAESLPWLISKLTDVPAYASREDSTQVCLGFFPDYTHGNPYQTLLYENYPGLSETVGFDEGNIKAVWSHDWKRNDIFHVHWLNSLFKNVPVEEIAATANEFLEGIKKLQALGVRIHWTVHNLYNHDLMDRDFERRFRFELSEVVDRVFVHHPVLLRELSVWLSRNANVRILEHGSYVNHYVNEVSAADARDALGFSDDDIVLCVVGQVRPYKKLYHYLPMLAACMEVDTRLKLLLAGKVVCEKTAQTLESMPPERVTVVNKFIDDNEIQRYLNAANAVLLTYEHILTSGSLFQAFSFSRGVIAPKLGSIEAYVADNFNGLLYDDESFKDVIYDFLGKSPSWRQMIEKNAQQTADCLQWPK